jgi:hypothetical protein
MKLPSENVIFIYQKSALIEINRVIALILFNIVP